MKTDRIFVLLLVVLLPMSGCFDDTVGDAEGAEENSGTTVNHYNNTTVVNHHYYNNTTNVLQDSPVVQVLYVENGSIGEILTSTGQIIEVLDTWIQLTNNPNLELYDNQYALTATYHCSTIPEVHTIKWVGIYSTTSDGATDWLPTDGTECTYTFDRQTIGYTTDVYIIYQIHN